ncbi:MAG: hypothetical protein GVY28_11960 [Alphaproteobacteria bacterium]|jgi:TPR repeat protein|nr:hypothetical protein [Alphaproteobacteria bacterium]
MTAIRRPTIALAVALMPVLAGCASYETGQSAYDAGNYDAAERRWQAASRLGDGDARFALASMLAQGDGVAADPVRAAALYETLATSGNAWAAFELANLLSTVDGPVRDDAAAARWYRQAADQDIDWARIELGRMILDGRVPGGSPGEAEPLFRAAAEAGNATAQYELALLLRDGIGAPADGDAALGWLERAAAQGHVAALVTAADLRQTGAAGVAADPFRASVILRQAAERGSILAMLRLGGAVAGPQADGPASTADPENPAGATREEPTSQPLTPEERALLAADAGRRLPIAESEQSLWLRRAATAAAQEDRPDVVALAARELDALGHEEDTFGLWLPLAEAGDRNAQHLVAGRLAEGIGVDADPVAATEWFRRAAEQGLPWAQYDYAGRLADGTGTRRDRSSAIAWYTRAGEAGIDAAWKALAALGTDADGVPDRVARLALQRAALAGDADAAFRLYELTVAGSIPGDADDAMRWLEAAAVMGNIDAGTDLGRRLIAGDGTDLDPARGIELLESAARRGGVDAQFNLAVALYRGVAGAADPETALVWFDLAARGGDGDATAWRNRLAAQLGPEKTQALAERADRLAPSVVRRAGR